MQRRPAPHAPGGPGRQAKRAECGSERLGCRRGPLRGSPRGLLALQPTPS